MRTGAKIGLVLWDQAVDDYNYQQLANNWALLEYHDHTPGRGVPIGPGGLGAGSVLASSIAAGVVGTQHLNFTPGQIGSWTSIVPNLVTNVVAVSGAYTPSVRYEGKSDVVKFKGAIQNNTGGTISSGTTICNIPLSYRPLLTVYLNVNGGALTISSSGVVAPLFGWTNSSIIPLDGLTFTTS